MTNVVFLPIDRAAICAHSSSGQVGKSRSLARVIHEERRSEQEMCVSDLYLPGSGRKGVLQRAMLKPHDPPCPLSV